MPSFHPKQINETLNSRESVALGGCFFYPLLNKVKNPIECSIMPDHKLEVAYITLVSGWPKRQKVFITQVQQSLKFAPHSKWLQKVDIEVLKDHDIVVLSDGEPACVLQFKFKNESSDSQADWPSVSYDQSGLCSIQIGLNVDGRLQLDGAEFFRLTP